MASPPLVAPGVCRYTVNGTYLGRPVANILDQLIGDNVGPTTRSEAIDDTAGDIIDAWSQHVLSFVNTGYTALNVSWVDLDNDQGETGSKSSTTDETWPQSGLSDGDPYAASVALLVTKQTSSGRGQRNGRMFIAGLDESFVTGNSIEPTVLSGIQTEMDAFTEALTETGVIATYTTEPVVVHTRNTGTPADPVIEFVSHTPVTSFRAEARVASQRRRNRP